MADAAEKEKAEKVAAAKKRYEQLKKQKEKGKKAGEKPEKKKESLKPSPEENTSGPAAEEKVGPAPVTEPTAQETSEKSAEEIVKNDDTILEPESPSRTKHGRQPSLSIQSKIRSDSFRRASGPIPLSPSPSNAKGQGLPALSPDGDAVTEIYRKQASRLEELERDNKRLTKEAEVSEARWRKSEEELEELRENNLQVVDLKARVQKADGKTEELNKLKAELASVQRQNAHLQTLSTRGSRRSNSPTQSSASPSGDLQAQLDSKTTTVESMEMEISNLNARLARTASSSDSRSEQVAALEGKLERAERAAGSAQRELLDVRKNLDRLSEKSVKEGSQRTSAETKIRTLSKEAETETKRAEEAVKRVEVLEQKLLALTNLHKESDARRRDGEHERERWEKERTEMMKRLVGFENENARLKEERERIRKREAGGGEDEGLDDLEDEGRKRLEARVRELEGELFDVRRGVWKERKRELDGLHGEDTGQSPSGGFDEVDLSGGLGGMRRQSMKGGRAGGFTNVLSSGFNAITGGGAERGSIDLVDDDEGFDEDAFRNAQEEEALKRVERVREVKRGLKDWEGFRLDLVELRKGGGGTGEIFDI